MRDVAFLCVSCAGSDLAVRFGQELQLQSCVLAFAERPPRWGQLGCNGLIVFDATLRVVCPSSPAFMEVQEAAFRHVERTLGRLTGWSAVAEPSRTPSASPGRPVQPLEPVASVSVEELDAQHEECSKALEELTRRPSRELLETVQRVYETHFAHEESLLDRYVYPRGAPTDGFSADQSVRASHRADHRKQLALVREMLDQTQWGPESIDKLLRAFENHARRYDTYGPRLAAALRDA